MRRYGVLPRRKRQQLYLYLRCPISVIDYFENCSNWDNFKKKQGTSNFKVRHPRCVEYNNNNNNNNNNIQTQLYILLDYIRLLGRNM